MSAPNMWSEAVPSLQIAWDATSLSAFMKCPRYYQYTIREGWRFPGNVDTDFGGFFASAVETYKKGRLSGLSKREASVRALQDVLKSTWTGDDPWGGKYEEQWRCTGTVLYRNRSGNKAKCPWSHKGVWLPFPAPDICGECGSPVELQRRWNPHHPSKDRYALTRLVAWYCDSQPDGADSGAYPICFPNGQLAVELSFSIPLPIHTQTGEVFILCGHLDSVMQFGSENFIADNKTTKNALTPAYFQTYSPNVQVDTYDLAGNVLWPELALKGVMIEAAQTLTDGARFGIGIIHKTEAQREEWLGELEWWLRLAEKCAVEERWPMNRASCYLCPFKLVCSKDPDMRQQYLESNFIKRHWNPLEER